MPRTVSVTVPPERSRELIVAVQTVEGVFGVQLYSGASVQPPGDVLAIHTTNRGLHSLMHVLVTHGVGTGADTSLSTSEPSTLVSAPSREPLATDSSEGTWEEMEAEIAKESNITLNSGLVMGLSGVLAVVGLVTNALHLVIAGMVIAPGFEPLIRIPLGILTRTGAWRRGLRDLALGYGALVLGAGLATVALRLLGKPIEGGVSSYLAAGVLPAYWTQLSGSSLLVTLTGGLAGSLLVASRRSVLTAGVMIALALVPGASLAAMGVVSGELGLAAQGAARWAVEVALVIVAGFGVFGWKRARLHRRNSLL